MGLLIQAQQLVQKTNSKMFLINLNSEIKKVFGLSNLDRLFHIALDLEKALREIHPPLVYLFDDQEDIIYFYNEILKANNIRIEYGIEIQSVLKRLNSGEVSLLLIDTVKQEEKKYQLVREIKKLANFKSIPIFVISIYEDEEFHYSQFGIHGFLQKPFAVEKFVNTIENLSLNKSLE